MTALRLINGTRVYIHAVIDNFSRKILAWTTEERLSGAATRSILEEAGQFLHDEEVYLMTDAGTENTNATVDTLSAASPIRRVLAQVDVTQFNSMIEAFWRALRQAALGPLMLSPRVRSPRTPCRLPPAP